MPGCAEDAGHGANASLLQICILEHDVGRFAPEFHRNALHATGRGLVDLGAGLVRPGERDLGNVGMLDQRCSDLRTEPGHHVDHAVWDACPLDELRELKRTDGSKF
ncbi:hypothetical protein D3C87_1362750 [compost metagenome]